MWTSVYTNYAAFGYHTNKCRIRDRKRIPDRNDALPDPASPVQGNTPAFAPTEVFEAFERYAKLFHEFFGGR
ncbi:MAG: hypothetical protein ACREQW_06550, partial [Candidatus Binatia bacterium]